MAVVKGFSRAETIIGSFNHKEIAKILPRIQEQQKSKKDFIVPASRLSVDNAGRLILPDVESFKVAATGDTFATWAEAERAADAGTSPTTIIPQKGNGDFPLRRTAERQLAERTGIPIPFIDKLREQGQSDLAATIFNERLRRPRKGIDDRRCEGKECEATENSDRFMVRLLDGKVRAILSDSYKIIDNVDLFLASAATMERPDVNAEVWQMRLTDDSFQMLAVSRGISGEVRLDRPYDPGDGWLSRWHNGETDTQYAALSISNSETGGGSASIAPAIMTRVCANFCVWAKTLRAVHLTRRAESDGLIESAEIQAAESRIVWMKVQQAIKTVFDPEKFRVYIERMNEATQRLIVPANAIGDPIAVQKVTEVVAERFDVKEDVATRLFANLMKSRDFTQYGTMQAATEAAHEYDANGDADRAREMESIGGEIAKFSGAEFRDLVKV